MSISERIEEKNNDVGVAKVKLLRHSGGKGRCGIDGDGENQF